MPKVTNSHWLWWPEFKRIKIGLKIVLQNIFSISQSIHSCCWIENPTHWSGRWWRMMKEGRGGGWHQGLLAMKREMGGMRGEEAAACDDGAALRLVLKNPLTTTPIHLLLPLSSKKLVLWSTTTSHPKPSVFDTAGKGPKPQSPTSRWPPTDTTLKM